MYQCYTTLAVHPTHLESHGICTYALGRSRMKGRLRIALIALIFHAYPPKTLATGDRGWFEEGCTVDTFHITKTVGSPAARELVLILPYAPSFLGGLIGSGMWADVKSKQCSDAANCEYPVHAKIRLDRTQARGTRISGRYSLDYFGSQHVEGQFVVKYRKPKAPIICE